MPCLTSHRVHALEPFALDHTKRPIPDLAIILADVLDLANSMSEDCSPEDQGDAALADIPGILGGIEADKHTENIRSCRMAIKSRWTSLSETMSESPGTPDV